MTDPNGRPITQGLYGVRGAGATTAQRTINRSEMLFIGDSHTWGFQMAIDNSRVPRGAPPQLGEPGTHVDQWARGSMASRLAQGLAGRPREVFISLGTNDGIHGRHRDPDQLRADIRRLVGTIRDSGTPPPNITWIQAPHATSDEAGISATRAIIRSELAQLGVGIIDPSRRELGGELRRNAHHPSHPAGYKALIDEFFRPRFDVAR
ncbi:MAG: SGNH/GDSL hydrolase family protein [Myxococcota bacterium]|nr:SGNH/GDSL hydrolase family protein [Myxococcota bacterium]